MGPSEDATTAVTTFLKTHLAVHPYDNQKTQRAHRDKLEAVKKFQVLALQRRSKEVIRKADGYWDSVNGAFEEVQQELLIEQTCSSLPQLRSVLSDADNHHSTFLPSDFGLLKKLGQGGYGAVYKAVHYPTGHIVALKEVDAGSSPVETRDQRMLPLECGIVPCYGTFLALERTRVRTKRTSEQAVPAKLKTWMVLKHCCKGSLADKLKEKGRLGPKEAAHVVKRLAKILTPLYEEHGLVHNDIKPANILYDGSNTILLCDLGCARKGTLLSTGPRLGGTYAHMSPEKLLQRKLNTSYYYNQDKIDVWAMGILLCQMVTGGEHPCAAIRKFVQLPSLQEGEDPERLYDKLEDCFSKLTLPSTTSNDPQLKRLLQDMLALDCGERLSIHEIKQQPWIQRHDKWTKKVAVQLKTTTTRLGTLLGPRVSPLRKKDDMALGEEASATEATTTSLGLSSRGISSLRRLNIALGGGPEQDGLPSI